MLKLKYAKITVVRAGLIKSHFYFFSPEHPNSLQTIVNILIIKISTSYLIFPNLLIFSLSEECCPKYGTLSIWVKVFNKILRSTKASRTSWKLLSTHRSQAEGTCPIKTHCGRALISVKTSSSPRKIYPKLKTAVVSMEMGVRVDFTFSFTHTYFFYFCIAFISVFLLLKKASCFPWKSLAF